MTVQIRKRVGCVSSTTSQTSAEFTHGVASGETKTLPSQDVDKVTLGIFSCSNYPAGFFTPYMDAWDGYPVERERLLTALNNLNKPVIALAGDTHNAWHNNLTLEIIEENATATWHFVDAILTKDGKISNTHTFEINA